MDAAGEAGGRIGLRGPEKSERFFGEGDDGICESVSIVRSDSDGRDRKDIEGVPRPLLVRAPYPSAGWLDDVVITVSNCSPDGSGCCTDVDDVFDEKYCCLNTSSEGRRNRPASNPRSALSLSVDGDVRTDLDWPTVGKGNLDGRGIPLLRVGVCWLSILTTDARALRKPPQSQ